MIAKHLENPLLKEEINKNSIFSNYNKTAKNFRAKPFKIKLNKAKKSKTVFLTTDELNTINKNKNSINSIKANSAFNSIFSNNNDLTLIASKNNQPKTCSNFYNKKNKKININLNDIIPNNTHIINIINFTKISSLYKSNNNSNIILNPKPEIKNNIINKIKEFNSVEKYIIKADKNINEIKHEYKPHLEEFYINKELKDYLNKSKKMIRAKNDINQLYRDSRMLNNVCDYVSIALFKLKTKKRNYIKSIKKELNQKKSENLHKKMLDLKLRNMQIPEEKIFTLKKFKTSDNLNIHPKLKAQIIYKSCYPYNSIRTLFDRYKYKRNLNLLLKEQTFI